MGLWDALMGCLLQAAYSHSDLSTAKYGDQVIKVKNKGSSDV